MKNCYESFLRWLTLWLPEDSTMREHLNEASYDGFENEFWLAIAPEIPISSPWGMRLQVYWHINFACLENIDLLNSTRTYLDKFQHDF